jgi:hypothetical protein
MNEEIQKYYQIKAKDFIDTLFDKHYFREDVTRDDMLGVENLLAWLFQTEANTVRRVSEINKKFKEGK